MFVCLLGQFLTVRLYVTGRRMNEERCPPVRYNSNYSVYRLQREDARVKRDVYLSPGTISNSASIRSSGA